VLASLRVTGKRFRDLTIMFLGAGSAATGIADLMVTRFESAGLDNAAARERLWFVDVNGLITAGREDIDSHNVPYAHTAEPMDFLSAIDEIKPDVLIGATGVAGVFTEDVVKRMCAHNERPVIFALSNPTEKAECTAEQCYEWSDGKALFASGSPFGAVEIDGQQFIPGQGNNAYIFPGVGLGALACEAKHITDEMFLASAEALAQQVGENELATGSLYPPMRRIRDVSLEIAVKVAICAQEQGVAGKVHDESIRETIAESMYEPAY